MSNSAPNPLFEECLKVHKMSLLEFSTHATIPVSTLKTWRKGKISSVGRLLLQSLIKIKAYEQRDAAFLRLKKQMDKVELSA